MIYFTFAHRFLEFILRRLYSVSSTECSLDGTRRRQNRTTTEKHRAEQTQTSDCSYSRTYLGHLIQKIPTSCPSAFSTSLDLKVDPCTRPQVQTPHKTVHGRSQEQNSFVGIININVL